MSKYILPLLITLMLISYNQYRLYDEKKIISKTISQQIENNSQALCHQLESKFYIDYGIKLSKLEGEIEFLMEEIKSSNSQILGIKNETMPGIAIFSIRDTNGYQKINTSQGYFFASIKQALPYESGYKIIFNIGNPYLATFHKASIKIMWGKSPEKYNEYKEEAKKNGKEISSSWYDSLKHIEIVINKDIKPGYWNQAEAVFPSTTIEELEFIVFELKTNELSLTPETQNNQK